VLPLFSFDQFVNAERVAQVGVGVSLDDEAVSRSPGGGLHPNGPPAVDRLALAVRGVLARGEVADRARELAAEIEGLPDTDTCVRALPALGHVLP
jgi:UDP:flavonoid glycosyltransferase YjiC (YdhE family)